MQSDQVKGIIERALTVFATMFLAWMVKKGWIGESDSAQLLPAIVLLPSLIRGWILNRPTSILQSAAAVVGEGGKKTVVIAPPELANATPETNIISTGASQVAINAAIATSVAAPGE